MADSGSCHSRADKSVIEDSKRKRKQTNEPEGSIKTIKSEEGDVVDIKEINEYITNLQLGNEKHQVSCDGKSANEDPKRKRKQPNEPEGSGKTIKIEDSEAVDIKEANESLTKQQLDLEKHQDSIKSKRILSGLVRAPHGKSYRDKLRRVIYLANVKRSIDPVNKFSFKITPDDPTARFFDEIMCTFNDGGQTGSLKIHSIPSFESPCPKIKLNNFISTRDIMKPFAILSYFTSFYDQSPKLTDMERLIICTNYDIDDDARDLWKSVDQAALCDSTTSLDSYVSTLFNDVGGKCYRLDYDCLTDGTFNELYQSCRKYSKRTRLAKLLVNAVKSKKDRLIRENYVVNEFYQAITSIIDTSDSHVKGSYRFTNEFLDSSMNNPPPGYKAFKLEFEEEYSQIINVWEDLKDKRLHVEEDFLLKVDGWENNQSDVSFPTDDIDQHLMAFCERFRLMCDTKSENELEETIAELQKNLHLDDRLAEERISEKPKPKSENPVSTFIKPIDSLDIGEGFLNIGHASVDQFLRTASYKLRSDIGTSPFRISFDALKGSELFRRISCESLIELDVYDVNFGAAVICEIISLRSEGLYDIFFINSLEFIKNSDKVKRIFCSIEYCNCLIIICNQMISATQEIVREWKQDFIKNSSKQVFIVKKTSTPIDLNCFCICVIEKESWKQWLMSGNIPLCSTTISPTKLFETKFQQISIEKLIKLLDWGKQVEAKNDIVKKYRQIESTFVHRPWIKQVINPKAEQLESFDHIQMEEIIRAVHISQAEEITFMTITEHIQRHTQFQSIFQEANNPWDVQEPMINDEAGKVLILLGEAGCGKSAYLTWLAWHLKKQNLSSLVVRCNLPDHCAESKSCIIGSIKERGKEIDETDALKLLYKLVHLSLEHEQEMAEICSTCLNLSNGQASVNEDHIKKLGISFNHSIELLLFKEKFNARELILLFDGFDEIEHGYKEVVLKCLSLFAQLYGVSNLYLTSRPYNCTEKFEKAFKNPTFYQLKPLSLQDKGSMLYKMMKEKWRNRNIDDTQTSNFCKALCLTHLHNLNDLIDNPLKLISSIGIFVSFANRYINFHSKSLNLNLITQSKIIFKPSFIVEEFVNTMIRRHLKDKHFTEETKQKFGLVALWVLFDESIVHDILSPVDINYAMSYMNEIQEAGEKIGIINGIQNGIPMFIHPTFAEVLCAWWILYRIRWDQPSITMSNNIESYWDPQHAGLRMHIDTIPSKRHPLHLAIIDKDWRTVESILSSNPKSLYEKNYGNRTPFHLIALYYDFEHNWANFLPDSVESDILNAIENVFGWTALDYAFHRDKPRMICYLLQHGASINVKVLFEQIVSAEKDTIRKAAAYARYVLGYLSSSVIEYESHDVRIKIKQFCDVVVAKLDDKTSANSELILDRYYKKGSDNDCNGEKMVEDIIQEDSSFMLESIIQRWAARKHFVRMITTSFFHVESGTASIVVLKYFMTKDPRILKEDILWDCIILSVIRNWNDEFKYFFDLYCSRIKIKDFQPCLIQSDSFDYPIQCDVAGYFIDYVENNAKNLVCDFRKNICWSKLVMPTEIMIDEKILSLLVICVATVRPSMLLYLIESCKWNLCAGIVFSLAITTDNLFSNIRIKPNKTYRCLLDCASSITNDEANKMLRLAITSQLFEFSNCLIERFQIDFQTVDEINGWNVFHLCASNQRSFWVDEKSSDRAITPYADNDRTDLFRYMLAKVTAMDYFGLIDKRGRSILHLAIENEQRGIVEHIMARRLGLNHIKEIRNLRVDAIPNITFCYRAIQEISKSVGEKRWHYKLMCTLAKQIAKISLANCEESQEPNSIGVLLYEDAKDLYQIAMKCRSLFLMYYLHREFPTAMLTLIYDADWLACTMDSLRSPDFLDFTKWLLNPNKVDKQDNLYEVVEECEAEGFDYTSVDLKILVKQAEAILSANQSVEEVCKLKLLAVAVCLKRESMIRYLCETLNVKIDWKVLIDIMVIAHQSFHYEPGTKYSDGCAFEKPDFIPIYKYLFERTSHLGEIYAEGTNVLHLAAQSGLGCMAKFLIKHNMVNVTTINEQNGWNIFHYYASCTSIWKCCKTENDDLLELITKRVLEITIDGFPLYSLTESRKNKLKELCFTSNDGRKSVIHVAVEAGNITTAEYIIQTRLGCGPIDEHEIRNSDECSRFGECYDELSQIAAQLPFNAKCDYLLHRLAKSIHQFSPENIEHITGLEDVEDHIIEDACRSAIRYRSLITLEHLIIACEDQMDQSLARSTSRELVVCMMECIRRNRTSMFKVVVGHYRTLHGIQPRVEVEFEVEENDNIDEDTIDEDEIEWQIIDQFTEDVAMNRDYLSLLILSVAYGRLPLTRYLVEMLQLEVNKSLIVLIMKVLEDLWDQNCKVATTVYEYLANRCGGNPNLLYLCIQAGCYTMLKYFIEERKLDPNEIDSENGWNVGHYCVSDPNVKSGYDEFTWLVDKYNMDCLGVYDRKGRNILHYALEHGYDLVVKYIIHHRLGLIGDRQPWYEWYSEKIDKLINELQQTIKLLPENIPQQQQQMIHDIIENLAFFLANMTSAKFGQIIKLDRKNDNERSENKNTKETIGKNSVRILKNVEKEVNEKLFIELINNSYFDLALKSKSVFVLAYFGASNSSFLTDEYLQKCTAYAALKNCNIEFKYFFDLYCSRLKIKDFQPCSIQIDKAYQFIYYSKSDEIDEVCDSINNICWSKFGIPVEFMFNEKILSLLVICMATVRPSILMYLTESCKLDLCAGIVYSLVLITNHLLSKIHRKPVVKPNPAYKCLLDYASNISDVEANKMLRLAITSQLLEFSKCLIERFNIDFQTVDEIGGWNIFHLCASNQRSFLIEEIFADGTKAPCVDGDRTDLFRYMMAKETDMNFFEIIDKKGRNILHLAMENEQRGIVEHIVARKLGLNNLNAIENMESVDAIPNIIFVYRAIFEILKSVREQVWHYKLICTLAKQIVKISLTNGEESQELNSVRLLLQEDATELYQMATKSRSLFLMYYLHHEFPSTVPQSILDEGLLVWIAESIKSQNIRSFKWGVRQYCQSLDIPSKEDDDINFIQHNDFEKFNADEYTELSVNLNELVKRTEVTLSGYLSKKQLCIMQLVAIAICSKHVSAIKYLCETFELKIVSKNLIDIMEIVHQSKQTKHCKNEFYSVYEYLFERISDIHEIDAEGRNMLHLSVQSRLDCMSKFMIEQSIFNVKDTNYQNGWNALHYFASRTERSRCGVGFINSLLQNVLQIESDEYFKMNTTETQRNKVKKLCLNSDGGKQSVIHVAVEAGNIHMTRDIIQLRLGISHIPLYVIKTPDEFSRFKECYEVVDQKAAKLPFISETENLLNELAKPIDKFSLDFINQTTVQYLVVEDFCRTAVKYRSVSTLEHLINAYGEQMNQALEGSTSRELFAGMMECIRRNRTNLFKVLVGHYCSLEGIQPCLEYEYEEEAIDSTDRYWLSEYRINWSVVDQEAHDVTMNREYIRLLILLVANGRLSMTKQLCQMLQFAVDKPLILLIMKVLKGFLYKNLDDAAQVCQYLTSRSEENLSFLHICVEVGNEPMLKYIINDENLDPSNDRSVLYLALENGHIEIAKYIIYRRLSMKDDIKPWREWVFSIEELINVLNQIMEHLPTNMHSCCEEIIDTIRLRKKALTTYYQLYTNQV